ECFPTHSELCIEGFGYIADKVCVVSGFEAGFKQESPITIEMMASFHMQYLDRLDEPGCGLHHCSHRAGHQTARRGGPVADRDHTWGLHLLRLPQEGVQVLWSQRIMDYGEFAPLPLPVLRRMLLPLGRWQKDVKGKLD
ncbi:MAG: hypothetical protein ACKPKO_61255, partial [Candidatus Fonsibacter sp.]